MLYFYDIFCYDANITFIFFYHFINQTNYIKKPVFFINYNNYIKTYKNLNNELIFYYKVKVVSSFCLLLIFNNKCLDFY